MVDIRSGKLVEKGHCESSSRRLREEFRSVHQLQAFMAGKATGGGDCMMEYGEQRPHRRLDYRTPQKFATIQADQAIFASGQACPEATERSERNANLLTTAGMNLGRKSICISVLAARKITKIDSTTRTLAKSLRFS